MSDHLEVAEALYKQLQDIYTHIARLFIAIPPGRRLNPDTPFYGALEELERAATVALGEAQSLVIVRRVAEESHDEPGPES